MTRGAFDLLRTITDRPLTAADLPQTAFWVSRAHSARTRRRKLALWKDIRDTYLDYLAREEAKRIVTRSGVRRVAPSLDVATAKPAPRTCIGAPGTALELTSPCPASASLTRPRTSRCPTCTAEATSRWSRASRAKRAAAHPSHSTPEAA